MTISYSDSHLWWDQTESLSVAMRQTDGTTKTATGVTCHRFQPTGDEPGFSGVDLDREVVFWRVPAALLVVSDVTYPLRIGDTLTDGTTTWQVQSLRESRVGSSLSHYVATCVQEIG